MAGGLGGPPPLPPCKANRSYDELSSFLVEVDWRVVPDLLPDFDEAVDDLRFAGLLRVVDFGVFAVDPLVFLLADFRGVAVLADAADRLARAVVVVLPLPLVAVERLPVDRVLDLPELLVLLVAVLRVVEAVLARLVLPLVVCFVVWVRRLAVDVFLLPAPVFVVVFRRAGVVSGVRVDWAAVAVSGGAGVSGAAGDSWSASGAVVLPDRLLRTWEATSRRVFSRMERLCRVLDRMLSMVFCSSSTCAMAMSWGEPPFLKVFRLLRAVS